MTGSGDKSAAAAKSPKLKAEKPKRLTPKPEVLRELYILSGNNCAMPDCDHLIIDGKGVVVGHVCHIEAALPDGARFNKKMSNEQRRAITNLVLMCGGHHKQIDSKQYEAEYGLERVRRIKREHEARLKGVGTSLRQSFQNEYRDSTDKLNPTGSGSCARLEQVLPQCAVEEDQVEERREQLATYKARLSKVPEKERQFMLAVIRRALKLDDTQSVLVHVDDIQSALDVSRSRSKALGDALWRYRVGDADLYSTTQGDEPHVNIFDPSDYVTWFDIAAFCDAAGEDLREFVIQLNFGLLDQ